MPINTKKIKKFKKTTRKRRNFKKLAGMLNPNATDFQPMRRLNPTATATEIIPNIRYSTQKSINELSIEKCSSLKPGELGLVKVKAIILKPEHKTIIKDVLGLQLQYLHIHRTQVVYCINSTQYKLLSHITFSYHNVKTYKDIKTAIFNSHYGINTGEKFNIEHHENTFWLGKIYNLPNKYYYICSWSDLPSKIDTTETKRNVENLLEAIYNEYIED